MRSITLAPYLCSEDECYASRRAKKIYVIIKGEIMPVTHFSLSHAMFCIVWLIIWLKWEL